MAEQAFSFKDYSLSPVDLIDESLDLDEEPEIDARWIHYVELSQHLDSEDLAMVVGDAFSTSDLLHTLIEEAKAHPFHPNERKRLHVNDAIRLGELVMTLIAQAQDDAIGLRMAVEGTR